MHSLVYAVCGKIETIRLSEPDSLKVIGAKGNTIQYNIRLIKVDRTQLQTRQSKQESPAVADKPARRGVM